MSDVRTAHSGNIRCNAVAIANAAMAATVTLTASANCVLRDHSRSNRRLGQAMIIPLWTIAGGTRRAYQLPAAAGGLKPEISPPTLCPTRGNTMAHETATLAGYVADLNYEDIPPEVLERAKVLTLDFLGSAIRARRDAESTPSLLKMLESLALDGKGESTVFGDSKTWTPAVAALLNGALGHSLDFDDTHADSSLHPSAPVVPAAFAVGELTCASGRDVLTAIVAGYEVCCRLGNALDPTSHYARGFHPTATAGTYG